MNVYEMYGLFKEYVICESDVIMLYCSRALSMIGEIDIV